VLSLLIHQKQAIDNPKQTFLWIDTTPIEKKIKKRVVETTEGIKTKDLAPNSYLGKQNQKVIKETVAKKQAIRRIVKGQSKSKRVSLSNLGIKMYTPNVIKAQKVQENQPVWAAHSEISSDFIEGVEESDKTALNTKEFIYYSYFQRIRGKLDLAWQPILKRYLMQLFTTGRQLASDMDHLTRTLVTLNSHGEIIKVQIIKKSGTFDLDQAAIEAFNRAGPFPNPPKGLLNKNGLIKIRWDFLLRS